MDVLSASPLLMNRLAQAAPLAQPAVTAALQTWMATGNGQQAALEGLGTFLQSPTGRALVAGGGQKVLTGLDGLLRSTPAYAELMAKAASPETLKAVVAMAGKLGKDGDIISKALTSVLKAFSKGGLLPMAEKLVKLSPKVVGMLGKASNIVPVLGLVVSGVLAARTLMDPQASTAQKAAAGVSLISGIVGTAFPGAGLATSVIDIGAGLAADGFDAVSKKSAA